MTKGIVDEDRGGANRTIADATGMQFLRLQLRQQLVGSVHSWLNSPGEYAYPEHELPQATTGTLEPTRRKKTDTELDLAVPGCPTKPPCAAKRRLESSHQEVPPVL